MATRLLRFTWILLVVIAVFLLSCTDNLLGKMKSNIRVSLAIPEAPRSRNVSTSVNLDLKVKGWVQDKQGEVLDLVEKPLENGRAVLTFNTVDVGLEVQILIQISDTSQVLYSGSSDFFEVSRQGNTVSVDLKRGDFASEQEKNEDEENGSTTGGEDDPAGSDGPTGDGGDDEPVGTVEVSFTVPESNWKSLINFSGNDLVIQGIVMGPDGSSSGEFFEGDFGDNTITFSNVPAKTEITVYAGIYYNPQQKYSYEEIAPNDGNVVKYLLHMNSSASFIVQEGTYNVDIELTPYESGDIYKNGYTYSCSSQEEIEELIALANPSVSISLEKDVDITNTITIDKNISFYLPGDIYDSNLYPSLLRAENVTGPMFEVTSEGNLSMGGIILDGQNSTSGINNPIIINHGSTSLWSAIVQNNVTTINAAGYNSLALNSGAIYSTGDLSIRDSTIQNITVNNSTGNADWEIANVVVASGTVDISNSTIQTTLNSNGGKYYSLMLGLNDEDFSSIDYNINYSDEVGGSSLQRLFAQKITPTSPPSVILSCSDSASLQSGIANSTGEDVVGLSIEKSFTISQTIVVDTKSTDVYEPYEIFSDGNIVLQRGSNATGPMFEIPSTGTLLIKDIILDGGKIENASGTNNPLIYNKGSLILENVTLRNNSMVPSDPYTDSKGNQVEFIGGGAIYSSGTIELRNCIIENISADGSVGGSVFIESGRVTIYDSSIVCATSSDAKSLVMGADDEAFAQIDYSVNWNESSLERNLQREYVQDITPTNPPTPY